MAKVIKILNFMLFILLLLALTVFAMSTNSVKAASFPQAIRFNLITSDLNKPVFITNAEDSSNRLFIVQQSGQIRIFNNGSLLSTAFLNISGLVSNFTGANGEQGLLGLAFDPHYINNGLFYITYTTLNNDATFPYATTLARYQVSNNNSNLADISSGMVILSIPKKYTNHNGGMIAFGPDGYLYFSMGDGGSGGDPDNNAQNLHTMLGKLLRIDVNSTPPVGQNYVIPPTNPFYGSTDPNVKKEIWAYGLRNLWRFSFDSLTGELYIGDVGQNREEEIDFQASSSEGGQNYGWRILEGNLCYNPSSNCSAPTNYVAPIAVYDHGNGCSVTGGYVYRGNQFPSLQGVYFYGDFCSGKLFGLLKNPNNSWTSDLIASTNYSISSFGEDEQRELYLTDYAGGNIYQLTSTTFADVPWEYWAWDSIERLFRAGLTSGCNTAPLMYCPNSIVTRDQMAVFLLKGEHGSSYIPPAAIGVFQDVPTNYWAADWIEQLAAEGITSGCNPNQYCPTTAVTRDQMAMFLLRAKHGSSYVPPRATGIFQDVPTDYWAADWIERLAAEGITAGCSLTPKLYCPTTPVSRDQMAVFLVKNFNLP
jgi:glucose/arabinose dehydrogenase